jgi:hypothetical protein
VDDDVDDDVDAAVDAAVNAADADAGIISQLLLLHTI